MRRFRTYPSSGATSGPRGLASAVRREGARLSNRASTATLILLLPVLLTALLWGAQTAGGAPATARFDRSIPQHVVSGANGDVDAILTQGALSVSRAGTMTASVTVTNKRDAGSLGYLEVRLRLRTPGGRLLYQKTQTRNDATGTIQFKFARSLDDLTSDSAEGRYRLQVRVFTSGADPVELEDRVLVYDPRRPPVPLVVVARLEGAPMTGPTGSFVSDPASDSVTREAADSLASAMQRSSGARVSLSIAPYLLDDWLKASGGYRVMAPGGARAVPATAPGPIAYGNALKALSGLAKDTRTELLDVPWADPDLPALVAIGAVRDLPQHYARALSSYRATIDASPSAGTAALCNSFPQATLPTLAWRGIRYAVLARSSLASSETTGVGAVRLRGSQVTALIIDERASAALTTPTADTSDFLDELFARHSADQTPTVVVVVAPLGQGSPLTGSGLVAAIDQAIGTGWVQVMTAGQAAAIPTTATALLATEPTETGTPPREYWPAASEARRYAAAFLAATGPDDPDARAAMTQALTAQSRAWAGPAQDWSLAARGRSFSDSALAATHAVFDKVTIQVSDVTLSGSSGRIPVTVHNASNKKLRLTISPESTTVDLPGGPQKITAGTDESFLTIPVDMGQRLTGRVTIAARSGYVQLAATSLSVTASFIDRLVVIVGIVLALLVLLFLVRRRVRRHRGAKGRAGKRDEGPKAPDGDTDQADTEDEGQGGS